MPRFSAETEPMTALDLTRDGIGAMLQILQAAAMATDKKETSEWQRHMLHDNCY